MPYHLAGPNEIGLDCHHLEENADCSRNYLAQWQMKICYSEFRRRGWQFDNGPTELQCKLSIGRLKERGRRWNRIIAHAVAAFDSIAHRDHWQHYWVNTYQQTT